MKTRMKILAAAVAAVAMAPSLAAAQTTFYMREKVNLPTTNADSTKSDVALASTGTAAPVCAIETGKATTGGKMLGRRNTTVPRAQLTDAEIAVKAQEYCATFPSVTACMVTIYDYNNGSVLYASQATSGSTVIAKGPTTVASNPPANTSTWAGACS